MGCEFGWIINISDLVTVGSHLGEKPLNDIKADVNQDGIVDILDLIIVAKHFGE